MRRFLQPHRGTSPPAHFLGRITLGEVWAAAAILVPVLIVTPTPLVAIDLAYQLRAGQLMLDAGHLLRVETFTATAAGLEWTNQQWLAQIVITLAFRAGGWLGLAILRATLAVLILALVYLSCRARGAPRRTAAWLTLAAGALLPAGFQLRPQILGMTCFALVTWLLTRRGRHRSGIFVVPIVTAAWANVHGSFFLAPVLVGLAWIEDRVDGKRPGRNLVLVTIASAGATLLSPLGLRIWRYSLELSTNPVIRRVVEEWQPPTIRSYTGAVFFLSVAGVAVALARAERPIPLSTYLTLGIFFAAGLVAIRGVYWWAITVPVALSPVFAASERPPRREPENKLNAVLVGLLGVAILTALVPWFPHTERDPPGSRLLSFAPPGVTRALADVLRPGEVVFNAQQWGSWFEFRFPENPVTTDSRFEVITDRIWRQNEAASAGVEGWQAILDGWEVDVVALARDQQSHLILRIRRDPGWRVVYEDGDGLVAVRR